MARPHSKATVITAEQIKESWDAQRQGKKPTNLDELLAAKRSEEKLKKEKAELKLAVAKLESVGPTALRAKLDDILKGYGITAAFEPLVELAMERYPADYPVLTMAGQLVCSVDQRIKIWTELLSYQLPKLKAIEVAGQVDHSLTVVIRRFGGDSVIERNVTPPTVDVPVVVVPERSREQKLVDGVLAHVKIKKF